MYIYVYIYIYEDYETWFKNDTREVPAFFKHHPKRDLEVLPAVSGAAVGIYVYSNIYIYIYMYIPLVFGPCVKKCCDL